MGLLTHFFSVKLYVDFTLTRRFSAESSAGWVRARLRGGRVRSESGECECHEDISYNPASGDTGDTVSVLASEGGNLVWLCFNVYKVIFMDNCGEAWCHLLDGFTLIKTHDMTLNNSCSKLTTKESLQSAVSPKDSKILDFDFFHNISMQVCYSLLQDQSSAKLIVCWQYRAMPSCFADESQNTRRSFSSVFKYDSLGKMGNKKISVPFEEVLLRASSAHTAL